MKSLAAAAVISPVEFTLTALSGKEKGSVYKLMASEITLGRGTDNDISIPDDPTCSRFHARILLTAEGFKIEGLSEKNSLIVDGKKVQTSKLNDGSSIELGNTIFKFAIVHNQLQPQAPHALMGVRGGLQNSAPAGMPQAWPDPQGQNSHPAARRPTKTKKLTPFRVIIGLLVILGLYLGLSDPSTSKKKLIELRTTEAIKADIEAANKIKEAALLENQPLKQQTQAYQEAQSAYIRGFRDHQKGIYGRAMEAFQACLSLAPSHQLCTRYLRLSQRKFSELTQYHMVLGRKYRDQNQFSACASAFSNVMVMIRDQNNQTYKEAKANYDACHAQVVGRF